MKRFQVFIEVDSKQVLDLFAGKCDPFKNGNWEIVSGDGPPIVKCDGMDVAKVSVTGFTPFKWKLTHIACQDASHGMHSRFGTLYKRLKEITGKTNQPKDCQYCDGSGWLPATPEVVQSTIMLCSTIMMFRGIRLIADGYKGYALTVDKLLPLVNADKTSNKKMSEIFSHAKESKNG